MIHTDAPFLAAIAADPDDPGRRLIYADWLEEQGDARSEFIRLMEEMKTLPIHCDRFAELRPRRNELRPQLDPRWITQMGYQPTHRPMFTKLPAKRHERWRLVEEFIDIWYGPLQPGDGYSEEELQAVESLLGFRLPAALREWYALAGKREDVWSNHDELATLSELTRWPTGTTLIFRWENQAGDRWGILRQDLDFEDPPIHNIEISHCVSPTTTAFALRALVGFATQSGHLWLHGTIPAAPALLEIADTFTPCDLPEGYLFEQTSRFYEGNDIIIEMADWPFPDVNVAALNEAACLTQLSEEARKGLVKFSE